MPSCIILGLVAAVFCSILGCSADVTKKKITVSAAVNLTDVFLAVKQSFEVEYPGIDITYNFASSGSLAVQIEQGAPVDLFASADERTMNVLANKGLIFPETRRDFVSNEIVLIKKKGGSLPLDSFVDLAVVGARRASIGNPDTSPAGRYAKEVLTNLGLWEKVKGKLVLGENVRQVLSYVERGEVDAGVVYATDAATSKAVEVISVSPIGTHTPIVYPIAVLTYMREVALGKSYIDFLLSAKGQEILRTHGFKPITPGSLD